MEVVSPTPAKSVLPSHSSHCSRPSSFSSSSSSSWISSPYNISNGSIGSSNSRHGGSRLRIISRIGDRVPWKNQGGTCSSSSTSSGSSACNGNGGFGFVLGERVEEKRRRERAARVVICGAGAGGIGREEEAIRIPERAKVVALVSLVMCLCNADRVVMSVAVVPLAAKYGWSSSFLGIVQVSSFSTSHAMPVCHH
ncbi:probable anion transporter 2, chloroplastic [Dioscorea cayenensis subsp. rotundata]|uniref:Probable anion transporter 2, chloroplastic n=1 Tax=Dioscorea cayennensis subsp. rotundata TaxID=55577 RepID=A0AB40D4W6_DIOCR|nr:probable anion transporter 2, chloroplastic [Dioscorea cayenensis subsp. rotundata]